MSLVLRLPREIHRCRSSSNVPCLPSYDGNATKPSRFAHFWKGAQSLAPATRKHIWTSKSAPYPTVFCAFHFEMCFAPQRRTLFRHLNFQKCSEPVSFIHFWLRNVLRATTAYTFSTSQLPKVLWTHQFFTLLTSKCASRHNGVHFFDISTSKSALNPSVLYTFDFEMCFAPQRRTLFRHLNFQKCSEPVSFIHFWLRNVLRATTAYTFSTSQLPKVLWTHQFFTLLTSKCASRHNGVHFFDISTSKSALNPSIFLHVWLRNVLRAKTACTFSASQLPKVLWTHQFFRLPATTACTFSTSQLPKVIWTRQFFALLTSKCASRYNGVHFFDISTSKSALNPSVFYTFDFEMCFAPQCRALFPHLNFQKWSEHVVLLTFWLRNVLRATTACNFSSLICPAGSAPAALASLLFDPPGPQIIGKTQCFATFLPFRAPRSSFFWDFLFLIFFLLLFSSLLWLLPPLLFICPYCRKFDF